MNTPNATKRYDVFISFSHRNEREAEAVFQALTQAGVRCFFSRDTIRGGQTFPTVIAEAVRGCEVFVLLLSNDLEESVWVPKELTEAINCRKPIVPFQLDESVERCSAAFLVNDKHWIKGFPGPQAEHLAQLVKHVKRQLTGMTEGDLQIPTPPVDRKKVALIYKRNTEPDETLLHLFEQRIREIGHEVFIDRHMKMGVSWAQEIERQIRESDAVIVLLSDRAGVSEMVLFEVQLALEEQDRRGKPYVLPIRIGSDTPLEGELGSLLNRLHYGVWTSPQDDDRILKQTLDALVDPPEKGHQPVGALEQPGGAVPLDSPYYIVRETDPQFLDAISRRDSIVLVKGGRQMGKTSLLARGLQHAREHGCKVVLTDFQTFSSSQLATDEALYKGLANALAFQLGLKPKIAEVWSEFLGANTNLEMFIQSEILEHVEGPIVWALDEVDRLFAVPFATDFFGMVRSWHNRRALEPQSPWSKLTLAIAYATEAHLFITDLNQSPFNVGTRITLADFSAIQVRELNDRYGRPLTDLQLDQLRGLVGGQPYLVRRALDELVRGKLAFDEFARVADGDEGVLGDHLRRILVAVSSSEPLLEDVRRMLTGQSLLQSEHFYRLRSAGIVVGDAPAEARLRCGVYDRFLRRHLLS